LKHPRSNVCLLGDADSCVKASKTFSRMNNTLTNNIIYYRNRTNNHIHDAEETLLNHFNVNYNLKNGRESLIDLNVKFNLISNNKLFIEENEELSK